MDTFRVRGTDEACTEASQANTGFRDNSSATGEFRQTMCIVGFVLMSCRPLAGFSFYRIFVFHKLEQGETI
jgi:hypothetical protein